MRNFSKILLVITLIAAMLAMSVSAVAPIANSADKKGWSSGKIMADENEVMYAYQSNAGHDPNGVLTVIYKPTEPVDLSKYEDDGYFHLMVYVNNPDALSSNGQIELTSSGQSDVEEIHWMAPAGEVEQGWNELLLAFDEAEDGGVDLSAINFFRFYWFPADGADLEEYGDPYFAVADLHAAFYGDDIAYPNSNIQWDNLTYFDMTGFKTATTDLAGKSSVSATSDSLVLVETGALATPIDLSKYEDGGYMHMWMYVEGAENFNETDGQFELTSGGACDVEETTFILTAADVHDGWNEIIWCFDDAAQFNANMGAINFIRFYKHVNAETTIIIRDISFGTEEEMDMVPETEPPATEPPATEAPETDAPAAEETTGEAPAEEPAEGSSNSTIYIIIAAVAVVVIAVVVVAVIASKKKKK